jgi:hypothetical protein
MFSLATLLCMLLGCAAVYGGSTMAGALPSSKDILPHHSLRPPFLTHWWDGGVPFWTFGESTVITDKYVRLTPDKQNRQGYIWNVEANELKGWKARFAFRTHSKQSVGADGMAFWYIEEPVTGGSLFGGSHVFRGIAVVMDTYDNDNNRDTPAVTILYNDGTKPRKFDINTDMREDAAGRCEFDFRSSAAENFLPIISLNYHDQVLEVNIQLGETGQEKHCALVTGIDLPTGYYFGFTADTGHIADNHDIAYFTVASYAEVIEEDPETAARHDPYNHHREYDEKSFWSKKDEGSEDDKEKPEVVYQRHQAPA